MPPIEFLKPLLHSFLQLQSYFMEIQFMPDKVSVMNVQLSHFLSPFNKEERLQLVFGFTDKRWDF